MIPTGHRTNSNSCSGSRLRERDFALALPCALGLDQPLRVGAEERIDDLLVERDPLESLQDRERLVERYRFLIGPVRGNGVERVRDRDDPGHQRDLIPEQPVGVALAAHSLVVPTEARDDPLHLPNRRDDVGAKHGVLGA